MARAKVHYIVSTTKIVVCFICAVQLAVEANPNEVQIETHADDYESYKCEICGEWLNGEITI